MSGGSSSSASKAVRQRVSIADLRAQAQVAAQDGNGGPIAIEDGDELGSTMSATLLFGSNEVDVGVGKPDFGSDDSDGPPSERKEEKTEEKTE